MSAEKDWIPNLAHSHLLRESYAKLIFDTESKPVSWAWRNPYIKPKKSELSRRVLFNMQRADFVERGRIAKFKTERRKAKAKQRAA